MRKTLQRFCDLVQGRSYVPVAPVKRGGRGWETGKVESRQTIVSGLQGEGSAKIKVRGRPEHDLSNLEQMRKRRRGSSWLLGCGGTSMMDGAGIAKEPVKQDRGGWLGG